VEIGELVGQRRVQCLEAIPVDKLTLGHAAFDLADCLVQRQGEPVQEQPLWR
jgi:hypothetical protein